MTLAAAAGGVLAAGGIEVPRIGLGTSRLLGADAERMVGEALAHGCRHIDTAARYDNEREVGRAVRASGLPRSEIFVATKIPHTDAAAADAPAAVEGCLERLGLDQVDLVYLHWPHPEIAPEVTLDALAPLVDAGLVRGLGVSNFPAALLRRAASRTALVADEVEMHPYLAQPALEQAAAEAGVLLVAYAPLAEGRVLHDPVVTGIARKHGCRPSQVALAWVFRRPNTVVIPKTTRVDRLLENLAALEVPLDEADHAALSTLAHRPQRFFDPPWAPDWDR